LPGTKRFSLAAGDILRLQGAATAQLLSSASLFGVYLRAVFGRDDYESLSVAPENLTEVLSRFTLQNDGLYTATSARGVYAAQYVGYWFGTHLIRQGANTDLVAMQFTNAPNRRPVAFLSDTQTLTTTSDYVFGVGLPPRELFSVSGQHKAGDVLRAQSQVQLEMVEGRTRADCWARIEIYENGTLAYRSIFDERHIRNSSESSKDHDVGAFSPFALYRTRRAGDHRIKLITDCNADKRAAMRAKYYGRHLTVDQFTFTEP